MVAGLPIVPRMQISKLGFRPCGRSSCLLAENRRLRDIVASRLILDWSPEQISGWLKNQYPADESLRVSHETIYRSLLFNPPSIEKKAAGPPAVEAAHAPLASFQRAGTITGADRRCHLDPPKACGSGRPSDSWPLGRRSAGRWKEQLNCDAGRTPLTLCHAD